MRQILQILLVTLVLSSCKKEERPKQKRFYMSVKIDGEFKETVKGYAVVEVLKNNYLTVVGEFSATEAVSFSVNNAQAKNYFWPAAYGIGYLGSTGPWATYTNSNLNIEDLSPAGIKGRFEFKAEDSGSDKIFTEGKIEADVDYKYR